MDGDGGGESLLKKQGKLLGQDGGGEAEQGERLGVGAGADFEDFGSNLCSPYLHETYWLDHRADYVVGLHEVKSLTLPQQVSQ